MQIRGDDFLKKVQLKQEKVELEKKLNELDETRISMSNINLSNSLNNAYKGINEDEPNEMDRLQKNIDFEENGNEFDNIMLNQPNSTGDDNKKKYLILGVVLVVLFLLTIIIIRLLSGDSKKEDPFTSNSANSSEMKRLSDDSNNIEDRYKRIIDDNAKKNASDPVVPSQNLTSTDKIDSIKENQESIQAPLSEIKNDSSDNFISNESLDETIKKVEAKKAVTQKEQEKPIAKPVEAKKSIKDLVEGNSPKATGGEATSGSGFFIQIGAFSKRPSDSYLNSIAKEGYSYKIIQEDVKGTTFNKLLIGPFKSRAAAQEEINPIKSKLNIKNTFIVNY